MASTTTTEQTNSMPDNSQDQRRWRAILNALEFFVIILSGMYLHLNRISILDLKHSKLPGLIPSASSTLFIFSVLCIFGKLRPFWPRSLKEPPRILKFFIELTLTLYVADLLMRHFWVPTLKFIGFLCKYSSRYLMGANRHVVNYKVPAISVWMAREGYFVARLLLAFGTFLFMLEVMGIKRLVGEMYRDILNNCRSYEFVRPNVPFMGRDDTSTNYSASSTKLRHTRSRRPLEPPLERDMVMNAPPLPPPPSSMMKPSSKRNGRRRARNIIDLVNLDCNDREYYDAYSPRRRSYS